MVQSRKNNLEKKNCPKIGRKRQSESFHQPAVSVQ